jgi:hypothetical protein
MVWTQPRGEGEMGPLGDLVRRGRNALFGDRLGLVLFLGSLAVFGLYWRIGVFITDTGALTQTLPAVARGQLSYGTAGPDAFTAPGVHVVDGKLYGRNYGQLVAAVPVLWTLQALQAVVDLKIAVLVGWSLLVLGFAHHLGVEMERRAIRLGGAVLALLLFALNVVLRPTPLGPDSLPVLALQVSSMAAAAMCGVLVYRLLALLEDRTTGVVGAIVVAIGTPVGFWASIPKRHALTTMLVMGVVYAFARSRHSDATPFGPVTYRALAYALTGLTTWVHAAEGFVLFVGLFVVDMATASKRDGRTLVTLALVFAASMLPTLLTNVLISGSPLKVPRTLPRYLRGVAESTGDSVVPSSGGGSASGSGSSSGTATPFVVAFAGRIIHEVFLKGVFVIVEDPGRFVRVFVRGGYIPDAAQQDLGQALYLTVLEAAPLLAGALAGVGSLARRLSDATGSIRLSPTDWLVAILCLVFTLLYLPTLPTHAQVTVRYLLPIYPLGVYAVFRTSVVRKTLRRHLRTFAWTYSGTVLIGGQLLVVALVLARLSRGEAFQLHALLALAAAAGLALAGIWSAFDDRLLQLTAVALGLTAGLGTAFVLLSGLSYFQYASYALPLSEFVARLLALG